jgi:DNA-binding SARP family transcriptional activator
MQPRWRIELLGGLRAEPRGEGAAATLTHFRTQKTATLLAYLAFYLRRSHPRETLIRQLWPDSEEGAGRHNLSVALSSLRQQLEPPGVPDGEVLVTERHTVRLNPAVVTTDVEQFEAMLRQARDAASEGERARWLTEAVELYRGELLPGFYDDWVLPEQERLRELYTQALRGVTAYFQRGRSPDRALPYALRALSEDRLDEERCCEVMRLYAALGQPETALRQYQELERRLREELNTLPGADARALAQQIERGGVEEWKSGESGPDPPLLHSSTPPADLEPVGGAVPLDSPFYVARPTDEEFGAAIARGDSIVLVKGTRQTGKTSLLARGLQQARQAGARVVLTDFQTLNASRLESAEALALTLAETLADQLELEVPPGEVWGAHRGPNLNLGWYLRRHVLGTIREPVVWGLDEVDRLFACEFSNELFALFRSWHNERALDPSGPWSRFTLAIAYRSEAHLFITDLNQSPFNVGTRLELGDFTLDRVEELNRRYGKPLQGEEVARFHELVNGHPYLVRRGLHEIASRCLRLADFELQADRDDGPFSDHLRHILALLAPDPELGEVARGALQGRPCPTPASFYRLRSAGVLAGASAREPRPRCPLYLAYLRRHLL